MWRSIIKVYQIIAKGKKLAFSIVDWVHEITENILSFVTADAFAKHQLDVLSLVLSYIYIHSGA